MNQLNLHQSTSVLMWLNYLRNDSYSLLSDTTPRVWRGLLAVHEATALRLNTEVINTVIKHLLSLLKCFHGNGPYCALTLGPSGAFNYSPTLLLNNIRVELTLGPLERTQSETLRLPNDEIRDYILHCGRLIGGFQSPCTLWNTKTLKQPFTTLSSSSTSSSLHLHEITSLSCSRLTQLYGIICSFLPAHQDLSGPFL